MADREETYDIRVSIGWGEWLDANGCRHSVADQGCVPARGWPFVALVSASTGKWAGSSSPGPLPHHPVPRKPAPARLWDCAFDGRWIRMRSYPLRLFRCDEHGVLEDEDGGTAAINIRATDWEHEDVPGSGVFVSPNGWEDEG